MARPLAPLIALAATVAALVAALPAAAGEHFICVGIGAGGPVDCYAAVEKGCRPNWSTGGTGKNGLSLQVHGHEAACLLEDGNAQ